MMTFGVLIVPILLLLLAAWVLYLILHPSTTDTAGIQSNDAVESTVFGNKNFNTDGTPMIGPVDLNGYPYGLSGGESDYCSK